MRLPVSGMKDWPSAQIGSKVSMARGANRYTILSVHDHLIKALILQQVTCFTLLDLSAAFHTSDHFILIEPF
jgi:hypothetical protein